MGNPTDMLAAGTTWADLDFTYNDDDDLESIRRWLFRALCPNGYADGCGLPLDGEPYIFIWPRLQEGEFKRPAITLRLLTTFPAAISQPGPEGASYDENLSLVATCYGRDGTETIAIAEKMRRAFRAGTPGERAYRLPMWWIAGGVKLARKLRVLPPSLSMGLDNTDDESMWSRPLEFTVTTPRLRPVTPVPDMRSYRSSTTVGTSP